MTRNAFLAIGECMVEVAPARDGLYRIGFAGDTFNTSWYARRLLPEDWEVGYLSAVGTDSVSQEMLDFIEGEGIATSAMKRLPDRTVGLYMISLKDGERSFSYWRGESAAKMLADDETWLEEALGDRRVIHFSGITLAILSRAARTRLCRALAKARGAGALVSFDTNLRPRLWESEAAMKEGLLLGASVADVVLPSFDEEERLFGDASPADTIARYRGAGAKIVAVKNGPEPGQLWSEDEGDATFAPPKVEKIIDSTAAGDSFGAGFLAAIVTGATVADAVERAAALASKVIGERGALAPQLFEQEGGTWTY